MAFFQMLLEVAEMGVLGWYLLNGRLYCNKFVISIKNIGYLIRIYDSFKSQELMIF